MPSSPKWSLPFRFSNILYEFLISSLPPTRPDDLIFLDLIALIIFQFPLS
jgi:hypothetical protein